MPKHALFTEGSSGGKHRLVTEPGPGGQHQLYSPPALTASTTRYVLQSGDYNSSPSQVHVGYAFYWKRGTALFTGIPDLAGRTITSAVMRVYRVATTDGSANTRIFLDNSASPITPTDGPDLLAKTHTTASVDWVALTTTSGWTDTPDFSAVLQEVVDAHGTLTSIQVLHDYFGTDNFQELVYQGQGSGFEPQLLLTYV